MKKNNLVSFFISMLFTISFCSFVIYAFYYFRLRANVNKTIITILQLSIVTYRNIAIFCLILALIMILIKSIIEYVYYTKNNNIENKFILNKISTRNIDNRNINIDNKKDISDYSSIINSLLNDKVLKIKFIDSDINEKIVRFSHFNKKDNTMEVIELDKTKSLNKDYILERLNSDDLLYCETCDCIVKKDKYSLHCNCNKKVKRFNPIKYVINMILILILFIITLFFISLIYDKYNVTNNKLNINVEEI